MGRFERFLTIWVAAAIAAGVGLGLAVPGVFEAVADLEVANVNLVVAVLIWLMIYPMMLKVEPSCLADVGRKPKGLVLTLTVNWLIKPFTMAALAVLFFRYVYGDLIPSADAEEYIAGMILLGVAPCTAMVFVWSQLTNGNPNYTLAQVSINDLILVFAFAPIAGLLLGVTDLTVPWGTLVASVVIFVVIPLAAGLAHPIIAAQARRPRCGRTVRDQMEADVHHRAPAHRRAAVRVPGRDDRRRAGPGGHDRDPAVDPELRHLRDRLRRSPASFGSRSTWLRPLR